MYKYLELKLKDKIKFGEVVCYGDGKDLVIVIYGNGVYLLLQVQKVLQEKYGINVCVIDMCWFLLILKEVILKVIKGVDKVLIVDECCEQGLYSEVLMVLFFEKVGMYVVCLVVDDCFIVIGLFYGVIMFDCDQIIKVSVIFVFKFKGSCVL